jgi:hypothetical protein
MGARPRTLERELPERAPERMALLLSCAPAGVQPVGFTPAELEEARRRRNPLVLEAEARGLPLPVGEP